MRAVPESAHAALPEPAPTPASTTAGPLVIPTAGRAPATTVSAVLAGAALLAISEPAGPVFLVLATLLAIAVLVLGWPELVGARESVRTRLPLVVTAVVLVVMGEGASQGYALGHLPVAIALGLIATFLVQLVRSNLKAGIVVALTAGAFGVTLAGSALSLASLSDARFGDRPVTLAAAGVAASVLADRMPQSWRGARLAVAASLGALASLGLGLLIDSSAPVWAMPVLGALAAAVSYAVRLSADELPGSRHAAGSLAVAAASLAAPGFAIAAASTLLLG